MLRENKFLNIKQKSHDEIIFGAKKIEFSGSRSKYGTKLFGISKSGNDYLESQHNIQKQKSAIAGKRV